MKIGTGKPAFCLGNNFGGALQPEPTLADRGVPDPVQSSSRCVFLTADRLDCMAALERCAWLISQGLCIRPGAHKIRYREPGVRL